MESSLKADQFSSKNHGLKINISEDMRVQRIQRKMCYCLYESIISNVKTNFRPLLCSKSFQIRFYYSDKTINFIFYCKMMYSFNFITPNRDLALKVVCNTNIKKWKIWDSNSTITNRLELFVLVESLFIAFVRLAFFHKPMWCYSRSVKQVYPSPFPYPHTQTHSLIVG